MESLVYSKINPKGLHAAREVMDEQTAKLAGKIARELTARFKPSDSEEEALNRIAASAGRPMSCAQHRNNIFKAAHALGLPLPSNSF